MKLVDHQIQTLCLQGMITPYNPELLNPASLDVTLGGTILIETAESHRMVPYPLHQHSQDNPYWMVPGQFLLAETAETFNIPDDVVAQFVLKSSRAREGLEHLLAGFIDNGFHDSVLTLELHNSRQLHPVPIWPGMRIGQIVFDRVEIPTKSYRVTGRYNHSGCVRESLG